MSVSFMPELEELKDANKVGWRYAPNLPLPIVEELSYPEQVARLMKAVSMLVANDSSQNANFTAMVKAFKAWEEYLNSQTIVDGSVTTAKLANEAVTSEKIGVTAVEHRNLAGNSVKAPNIEDGAVVAGKLGANAVQTNNVEDGAISREKLAKNSVDGYCIADRSINGDKLFDLTLTGSKIISGAIVARHLADAIVTASKIADGAITSGKIADGAVTKDKLEKVVRNSIEQWNNWYIQFDTGLLDAVFDGVNAQTFESAQAMVRRLEAQSLDMGGNRITGVGEPVGDDDAANKKYVDTKCNSSSSSNENKYAYLNGLKYYAFGDSIVDMQGTLTAPETFGDTGYSKDLQGRDISGVTVEGYVTAVERRYGLVASNFGLGGHTIVGDYAMIASKDFSDVALVTIAYGVNDARTGVPLGTVNSTDVSTFAGAMNVILKKIYTDNPECRVLILSPLQRLTVTNFGIATPNANGNYLIDFVNMCRAIAEKRSTAFLDQYRCTGINQTNLYYYTVEGVHPVNQGFARIRNAVIGILDGLFALEYEPFGVMTNTGDTEPDEPDTGGDTGDDTPPEEDTAGASIDLTDKFVYDAIIYDCYVAEPNLIGSAGYNASSDNVCTGPVALEVGKVYTLTTYWSSSPAYIGLINGAESRGAYVDGAWAANRVGSTTINRSKCVQSTETIDGVECTKMVYSYTPTEPKWLWVGSERAYMGMTTLTYV